MVLKQARGDVPTEVATAPGWDVATVYRTYSPQLNPIERVWRQFRRNVTDNVFFKTLGRLLKAVDDFLAELASQAHLILSIVA